MKQEEMSDIRTILIEATDERSEVMSQVGQVNRQGKPVIIVLPEQSSLIFNQPGDFYELKRLKRERGLAISLVISGHERVRSMARRQGFQVFASTETCLRAMARRDRLYAMRGITHTNTAELPDYADFVAKDDEQDEDVPWSWEVKMSEEEAVEEARVPGIEWILAEEQLWDETQQPLLQGEHPMGATPLPAINTDALTEFAAQSDEKGPGLRPLRLVGLPGREITAVVPVVQPLSAPAIRTTPITEPLDWAMRTQSQAIVGRGGHKLILALTALLILGILGGIGFGYALSLLHFSLGLFTQLYM